MSIPNSQFSPPTIFEIKIQNSISRKKMLIALRSHIYLFQDILKNQPNKSFS